MVLLMRTDRIRRSKFHDLTWLSDRRRFLLTELVCRFSLEVINSRDMARLLIEMV